MNHIPNNLQEVYDAPIGSAVYKAGECPTFLRPDPWHDDSTIFDGQTVSLPLSVASRIISEVGGGSPHRDYYHLISRGSRYIVLCRAHRGDSALRTLLLRRSE